MGLFGFGKKKKTTQSGQTASASVLTEIREEGKKDQLSDKINNMIKNFSALSKDERQYLEDNWMNMTTPQKFEYKEALGRYMEALSQNIRDPEAQEDLKFLAYRNQNYKENYDKTLKKFKGSSREVQLQWIEQILGRKLYPDEQQNTDLEEMFSEAFFGMEYQK